MATCIACDAEIETGEVEVGETVTCLECGADMEAVTVRPLELELVDDAENEAVKDDDAAEDDVEDEADDAHDESLEEKVERLESKIEVLEGRISTVEDSAKSRGSGCAVFLLAGLGTTLLVLFSS